MIPTSASPNRTLLVVVGLVLVLLGGAALAVAFGVQQVLPQAPEAGSSIQDAAALPVSLPILVLAVCLLLGVFALTWLIAAVPRSRSTSGFRLHRDGREGVTELPTKVLQQAIEERAEGLLGVVSAAVRVAGTADHPDLLIRAQVDERINLGETLAQLHGPLPQECEYSLGAPLASVRVVIDPVRESKGSRYAEIS